MSLVKTTHVLFPEQIVTKLKEEVAFCLGTLRNSTNFEPKYNVKMKAK